MKGEYLNRVCFATAIFCSEVSEWGHFTNLPLTPPTTQALSHTLRRNARVSCP